MTSLWCRQVRCLCISPAVSVRLLLFLTSHHRTPPPRRKDLIEQCSFSLLCSLPLILVICHFLTNHPKPHVLIMHYVKSDIMVKVKELLAQLCLSLFDPVDWSPPGFSVRGILQARILEWVAIPFSRGSSRPRMEPGSSALQAGSLPSEPPGKPMWWWHSCSLSRAWGTGHLCSMWTQLGQLEA